MTIEQTRGAPLEDDVRRVYMAVLQMAEPTRGLLLAQGMPAARLDPALAVLEERGLVHPTRTGLYVEPPLESLPRMATELERQAATARGMAHELTQVYYSAREPEHDAPDDVVVLRSLREVADASNLIVSRAREEVRCLRGATQRSRQLLDAPLASQREPTVGVDGKVITLRTLWEAELIHPAAAREALDARAVGGEEQRFMAYVPLTVVVVDDDACLIEWTDGGSGSQGLLGYSPGALGAAAAMFERYWAFGSAMPWRTSSAELGPRDQTILRLLAAGLPDASIARQAGCSQRTVERRIRQIMERLGAQTRFQAGVQAAVRNLL